jgi:hypothetical protein
VRKLGPCTYLRCLVEHGEVTLDWCGKAGDDAVLDDDAVAFCVVTGHDAAGMGEQLILRHDGSK